MSAPKIVLTTILTLIIVIAFGAVAASALLPREAIAHAAFGPKAMHRFSGVGRADLASRCERLSRDHSRLASAMVTAYLDLDSAQEDALDPMLDVVSRWREDSQSLCFELADAESPSIDAGLASMEAFLSRTASAAGELRAAYSGFEATLTAEQQQTIGELLARHRSRG